MSESFDDQVDRLGQMVNDVHGQTWDLSANDRDAIRAVLMALANAPSYKTCLVRWLETEFRHALKHDKARLLESLWMLKVGHDKQDAAEDCMARAICSFVKGLILGERPVSVPVENN